MLCKEKVKRSFKELVLKPLLNVFPIYGDRNVFYIDEQFYTYVDLASLDEEGNAVFKLPRLDTNDLPKSVGAEVINWY